MESYKAQMNAALKEQQDATAALRARIETDLPERFNAAAPSKTGSTEQQPVASPSRNVDVRLEDDSDTRSADGRSSGDSDFGAPPPPRGLGTPIATLRRKLSLYAKQRQVSVEC